MNKKIVFGVVGAAALGVCSLSALIVKKACDARALYKVACDLYDESEEEDVPFEAEYIIEFAVEPLSSDDDMDDGIEQKKGS